jgi:small GTP-binding protein
MYVTNCLSSYKMKILILGSANSGKHLLCSKYASGFDKKFEKSIGVDIYVRDFKRPDGELISMACWNCAPEKKFEPYWPKFFRGAAGAIILFDITNRKSYEEAKSFIAKIHQSANYIPIILIGNKVDLKELREVKYSEAFQFAEEQRLAAYSETSIKDDINILESLELLNRVIYFHNISGRTEFDPSEIKIDVS